MSRRSNTPSTTVQQFRAVIDYYDIWFDPDTFDWENNARYLAKLYMHKYDDWGKHCTTEHISYHVFYFIKYANETMDDWWDESFLEDSYYEEKLLDYALDHIDVWYSDKYFTQTKQTMIVQMLYV